METKTSNRCRYLRFTILVLVLWMTFFSVKGRAAAAEEYTAAVHGAYRHPQTGEIEDSGGEGSYALGQSMVDSVVDPVGLLQLTEDGTWVLHLRFHLMDNISDVSLKAQAAGDAQWTEAESSVTAAAEESKDFCVALPSKDAVVRAECYVTAMGRSVIFYVTYDNLTQGNTTDFQTDGQAEAAGSSEEGSLSGNGTGEQDDSQQAETAGENTADSSAEGEKETEEDAGIVLDDSFWRVMFAVIFCASFCAGGLLLLLTVAIGSVIRNKKAMKEERLKKFDKVQVELENDDFDFDFLDELQEGTDL